MVYRWLRLHRLRPPRCASASPPTATVVAAATPAALAPITAAYPSAFLPQPRTVAPTPAFTPSPTALASALNTPAADAARRAGIRAAVKPIFRRRRWGRRRRHRCRRPHPDRRPHCWAAHAASEGCEPHSKDAGHGGQEGVGVGLRREDEACGGAGGLAGGLNRAQGGLVLLTGGVSLSSPCQHSRANTAVSTHRVRSVC